MLGHVAHALERGADAQRRDDDAQVAGDRLLAGEDLDGLLVEGHGQRVDLGVVGDDLFGQLDVAGREGAGGLVDRDRDEVGDLHELGLQVLEGLMEDFAHVGATFRSGLGCGVNARRLGRPRERRAQRSRTGPIAIVCSEG